MKWRVWGENVYFKFHSHTDISLKYINPCSVLIHAPGQSIKYCPCNGEILHFLYANEHKAEWKINAQVNEEKWFVCQCSKEGCLKNRKWCHRAYQLIWLHSFMVSWDGLADGWQAFPLGPQFGARVTVKVKASENGDTLAASVHTATVRRSFGHLKVRNWSGPWRSNTNWSQRFVSSQVGSFMFFRTLLTILSSSFLALCSSSSVLFILLLSWRRMRERERQTSGRM